MAKLNGQFTQIPNATLRDVKLSIEARGTLAYILSHDSKTFKLNSEKIQKDCGIGREKLQKIVKELKKFGYLRIVSLRTDDGKLHGKKWIAYSESQDVDFTQYRMTEKPSDGETDTREKPSDGETDSRKIGQTLRTPNLKKKKNKEESSALEEAATTAANCARACSLSKIEYQDIVFDGLADRNVFTSRNKNAQKKRWQETIDYAFSEDKPHRRVSPEIILECFDFLKNSEGRKYPVSAENVLNNLGFYLEKKEFKQALEDFGKAIDNCDLCDEKGFKLNGGSKRILCNHIEK